MFSFLKKLFGTTPAEAAPVAPYKIEGTAIVGPDSVIVPGGDGLSVVVEGAGIVETPAVALPIAEAPAKAKKPRAKKPAGEKKPRAKKAPKA